MGRAEGNKHHPLFDGPIWDARRKGKDTSVNHRLRNQLMRTVRLDVDSHDELHRVVSSVPVPDRHFMHRLENNFVDHPKALKRIDNFLIAAGEALTHPQATVLEQTVALCMIEAVELQLPYIREGIIGDGK